MRCNWNLEYSVSILNMKYTRSFLSTKFNMPKDTVMRTVHFRDDNANSTQKQEDPLEEERWPAKLKSTSQKILQSISSGSLVKSVLSVVEQTAKTVREYTTVDEINETPDNPTAKDTDTVMEELDATKTGLREYIGLFLVCEVSLLWCAYVIGQQHGLFRYLQDHT